MELDVTALGELLIDVVTQSTDADGYPTMVAHPGGAPCNFLAALSKYGARTAFLGKVGEDAFGRLLTETLRTSGIETRGLQHSADVFTTMAFVTLDASGDRQFSFARKPGADTMLTFAECDLSLIDAARVFHFGTLSLTDEPARSTTRQAVEYAREKGKLITFDPNLRLPLWRTEDQARAEILWGLSRADVVKISDEEVRFLWGCGPEEGAARILQEYGAQLVFVTLGPDGCYYANRQASGRTGCPRVHPVDTTGAGDIFGGSAVSGILRCGRKPAALTGGELHDIARFASAAASLSTERYGGISSVPEEAQVRQLLERGDW